MMRVLFLFFVALAVIGALSGSGNETEAAPHVFDELDALDLCQTTIKGLASYDGADVPYAKNYGRGSEYYFSWNGGNPILMTNGFGARQKMTGSCIVTGRSITSLTLNGKTLI